ncbi:MAG TPA: universal stress protein [Pseudonocardiaceae bacterium]|nr:universal stress protein [Pseudonocardiaceae bacterium]
MTGDDERHRASAEARGHVSKRPVTMPAHGEAVARYLGAQHYRESTAREREQQAAAGEQATTAETVRSAPPIVVGVDGSRFGQEALRWALAEAGRRDCSVRAVLVAHTAPVAAAGRPSMMGMAATVSAEQGQEHLIRLQDTVLAVLGEQDDPRLSAGVLSGGVPETLCDLSRDAQLLVVGSHGHGALFEAVLGSVARYCVRHASCPVVVIPARLAPTAESDADGPEPDSYGFGPLL